MSEEGKENIRESNRRRWADPIEREKQIEIRKQRKHTKEEKERISKSLTGHTHSTETKKKIGIAHKGLPKPKPYRIPQSEKSKRKISLANRGRKHTDSAKLQMSISRTGEKNPFFGRVWEGEMLAKISGENSPHWKGGTSFAPYCIKFNAKRKRAVRKFFNRCLCCGCETNDNIVTVRGKITKPIEFDVHHIDHDKEQGCNGKPFNLVPLCRRCHALEGHLEEEYKTYINNTLREGFKWGIWSEQEYIEKVMYPE